MTDPIHLRRRVRWVLSTLPKPPPDAPPEKRRRLGETMIADKLRPDFPELKADELSTALHWNHSRGFIEFRHNEEEERNEWSLTNEGWHKEGLA